VGPLGQYKIGKLAPGPVLSPPGKGYFRLDQPYGGFDGGFLRLRDRLAQRLVAGGIEDRNRFRRRQGDIDAQYPVLEQGRLDHLVAGRVAALAEAVEIARIDRGSLDDPQPFVAAIDALLKRLDSRVAEGKPALEDRTVLLIDESGLQSSPQLARILDHIRRDKSQSVLVVVGDERQVRPLGPGHAIRLVREAIGAATLSQIHRQREAWAREAPQAFARGDAAAALKAFDERGLIEFHDGLKPTVNALADAWQQARRSRPNEQITVLTKSNAEARAVAAVLRDRLKREGAVGTREVLLPAVDASGNPHTLAVAAGDTLVALRRVDWLGVVNGTSLTVERIKVARLTKKITITARRGNDIIQFTLEDISDGKGRVRLANGLVSTIFRSQGATVDQALVLLNDRFDRHDAYVSASRARGDTRLFCSRSIDSSIRAASGDFHSEIDDAQRLDHLAQRLSRERIKTTTLDLIDIAKFAEAHTNRERSRQKELGHEL
jgi:ATP-dependent exoDNAse (exonuclease V) alpha subunit